VLEDLTGTHPSFGRLRAHSAGDRREAVRPTTERRTSFPWNDTAHFDCLDAAFASRSSALILDVARALPDHPVRCGHGPRQNHIERRVGRAGHRRRILRVPSTLSPRGVRPEDAREFLSRVGSIAFASEIPALSCWPRPSGSLDGSFVFLSSHAPSYYNRRSCKLATMTGPAIAVIKETIEFDPKIPSALRQLHEEPDEKTALEQFGLAKYFRRGDGPGHPSRLADARPRPCSGFAIIRHELRRATLDEKPERGSSSATKRDIFPLFHRVAWFAEATYFLLYDVVTGASTSTRGCWPTRTSPVRERSLGLSHQVRLDDRPDHLCVAYAAKSATVLHAQGPAVPGRGPRAAHRCSAYLSSATAKTGFGIPAVMPRDGKRRLISLESYVAHVFLGSSGMSGDGFAGHGRGSRRGLPGAAFPRSTESCASSTRSRSTAHARALRRRPHRRRDRRRGSAGTRGAGGPVRRLLPPSRRRTGAAARGRHRGPGFEPAPSARSS